MTEPLLGKLERIDVRTAWTDEAASFTPWLAKAENLALLGEALGMALELEATEQDVGPFRADILCKDIGTDGWVIVENQLERTDHAHLGQLLTYAAGLEATTIVWVAPRFTDEHRAALDWLNEATQEPFSFFGVEIELWRIGSSPMAPKFNVVSKPNDWTKSVQEGASRVGLSEKRQLQLEFWTAYRDYLGTRSSLRCTKPQARHWMSHPLGKSGVYLASVASFWDAEANTFHGVLRAELVLDGDNSRRYLELLSRDRADIERGFGVSLTWYSPPDVRTARIYVRKVADLEERSEWPEYFRWLADNLDRFERAFGDRIRLLSSAGES